MAAKSVVESLEEEIISLREELKEHKKGSPEYDKIISDLCKMTTQYNDLIKTDYDYWSKQEDRSNEYDLKKKQMEYDRRDRFIKNTLTGISIFGGFGITIWGALTSMAFEKTDNFTSSAGREFVRKILSFYK